MCIYLGCLDLCRAIVKDMSWEDNSRVKHRLILGVLGKSKMI